MKKPPSINKIINTPEISEFIPLLGKGLITQIARDIVEKYRTGKIEDDPIDKTKELLIDLTNPDKLINATGNPFDIRFQNIYKIPLSSKAKEPLSSTNDYLSPLILQNLYDYHLRIYPSLSISISHLLNSIGVKKIVISTQNSVDFGDIDFPNFLIHHNIQITEVGTTNRVHIKDYENAIENGVDAIVIPLTPRFEIVGFENHPEIEEIIEISREKAKVIIILDNALLLNISPNTIPYEFSVEKYLNCGCDITFVRGEGLMSAGKSGLAFISEKIMDELPDEDYFTSFKQSADLELPVILRLFKYLDKNTIEHPIINLLKRDKQTLQKDIELLKKRLEPLSIKGRIKEKEVFVCGKLRNTAHFIIDSGISGDELNHRGIITRSNRSVIDVLTLTEDDIDRLIENIRR